MEASLQYLQTLQGLPAYALVLGLLVACGIGAPMNEDIVLLIASALTLTGVMDPLPLMAVGWVGLIAGDALSDGCVAGPILRSSFPHRASITHPCRSRSRTWLHKRRAGRCRAGYLSVA